MSKEQLGDLESAFAKQVADLQEKETQAWDKRIRLEREWMAKISKGLGIQVVATRASVRFAATDLNDRLATQALVAYEREKALDGELRDTIRDLTVVRQTIVDRIAAQANANLVSQDDATDGNATDDELAQLRGDWSTEFMLSDGAPIAIKLPLGDTLNKYHPLLHASFRGSDWVDIGQDGKGTRAFCSINLDASVNPKKIDLVRANGVIRGIYRCEANTLWLCLNADQTSNRRPDEFTSGAGDSRILMRCERSTAKHVQSAVTPLSDTDRKGSGMSMQTLDDAVLKLFDKDQVAAMKHLYSSHLHELEREVSSLEGSEGLYQTTASVQNVRNVNLVKIDKWCERDELHSLSRLVAEIIGRAAEPRDVRLEAYRAECRAIRRQLDLIRKYE